MHPNLKTKFKSCPTTQDLKEEFSYFQIKDFGRDISKWSSFNKCLSQKGIEYYNSLIGGKTLEGGQKIQGLNEILNGYRQEKSVEEESIFQIFNLSTNRF